MVDIAMQTIATITPKFQIHLPKEIRQKAGFTHHGPVVVRADKGKIVIEKRKEKSILDLAGKYKLPKSAPKIDVSRIRDYIDYSDL